MATVIESAARRRRARMVLQCLRAAKAQRRAVAALTIQRVVWGMLAKAQYFDLGVKAALTGIPEEWCIEARTISDWFVDYVKSSRIGPFDMPCHRLSGACHSTACFDRQQGTG